jgi:uncharacterized spore protein YtfJ
MSEEPNMQDVEAGKETDNGETEEMETPVEFESMMPVDAVIATQDTLEQFLETADVDRVYGEPIRHGDTLIIPAAEVLVGMGFGMGYGGGNEAGQSVGGGGGGGGGGRTFARPVATIIASPDGVRVEPVVDVTKIALAVFTTAGFMIAMFTRMLSPRKAMKAIKGD